MGLNLSYSLADQDFHHTKSLGVWNVSTQLLDHLAVCPELERLTVFINRKQSDIHFPANARLEQHNSAVTGRMGRVFWDQWGVYSAAKKSGNDWLFLPKGFAPAYRPSPVRVAAYVHDAMHVFYQRTYRANPLGREAGYFIRSLKATLRNADIIFTNSEFTRREVQRLAKQWNIPPPKLVQAGVGFDTAKPDHGEPRRRIVVLAGPWPHKCTGLAIKYLDRWARERSLTTGVDWIGALPTHASLPKRPGWRHYVRLAQYDYEKVLRQAAVVVYFSAYEGFGMPPVEGTMAGAAAVYSAIPAMTEVMGQCGFPFSNDSYEQFARALNSALKVDSNQLASWREELARRHNWSSVARRIISELAALDAEHAARFKQPASTKAVKLAVFAHTPPPHHGQSYMVKLMLDGFGGDQHRSSSPPAAEYGIACYHINARLSQQLEDIGDFSLRKVALLFGYGLQAIWCRFHHGATTLYYVPAPGKISALVRDWLIMLMCRPFYRHIVLHWHAAGMAEWLGKQSVRLIPWLTQKLLGRADLSIVLTEYNRPDAELLQARRIRVVGNGIPDPCPDFDQTVLPRRMARFEARKKFSAGESLALEDIVAAGSDPEIFRLLFLAHCVREKGLFDTLDAIAIAAEKLRAQKSSMRLHLTVAGEFISNSEEVEFASRIQRGDLLALDGSPLVSYVGFVSGDRKRQVFLKTDCFCFPTYYYAESFGLVLVEAMSFGVPVITSRWRSVPELLPPDYNALVDPRSPEQIADAILRVMVTQSGRKVRKLFEERYRLDRHLANMAAALHSIEPPTLVP